VTTAPLGPVAVAVRLAGVFITGGVVSVTVTVKLASAVLSALSVDEQSTVVVPIGKVVPGLALQVTGSVPSTKSVALGAV
jgi:hypothetical protein